MTDIRKLTDYSDAIEALALDAARSVASLCRAGRPVLSGVLWRDGIVVTSEQSLGNDPLDVVLPDGRHAAASCIGRDPTTNVALLRLGDDLSTAPGPSSGAMPPVWAGEAEAVALRSEAPAEANSAGGLVLALGGDGRGGASVGVGHLEVCGPAWESQAGGRIDRLLRLGITLSAAAEGGAVVDARGRLLGMSTFGPRRSVLVIPVATIDRVVGPLLEHGRIPRGWLGAGLHRVTLPRELAVEAGAATGLMVVSLAEGAPASGRLMAGDILLTLDGRPLGAVRDLAAALRHAGIGARVSLNLLRAGLPVAADITIGARP